MTITYRETSFFYTVCWIQEELPACTHYKFVDGNFETALLPFGPSLFEISNLKFVRDISLSNLSASLFGPTPFLNTSYWTRNPTLPSKLSWVVRLGKDNFVCIVVAVMGVCRNILISTLIRTTERQIMKHKLCTAHALNCIYSKGFMYQRQKKPSAQHLSGVQLRCEAASREPSREQRRLNQGQNQTRS
jgi:hypothetical protein